MLHRVGAAVYSKRLNVSLLKVASPSGTLRTSMGAKPASWLVVLQHRLSALVLTTWHSARPRKTRVLVLPSLDASAASRWPSMHRVRPPAVEPALAETPSTRIVRFSGRRRYDDGRIALEKGAPPTSKAVTRTEQRVPAVRRASDAACVRQVSWPEKLELRDTLHVATSSCSEPTLSSCTPIRVATSENPSPISTSSTPPAALPSAKAPPPAELSAELFPRPLAAKPPLSSAPATRTRPSESRPAMSSGRSPFPYMAYPTGDTTSMTGWGSAAGQPGIWHTT